MPVRAVGMLRHRFRMLREAFPGHRERAAALRGGTAVLHNTPRMFRETAAVIHGNAGVLRDSAAVFHGSAGMLHGAAEVLRGAGGEHDERTNSPQRLPPRPGGVHDRDSAGAAHRTTSGNWRGGAAMACERVIAPRGRRVRRSSRSP